MVENGNRRPDPRADDSRREWIDQLRAVADFLETHPDWQIPGLGVRVAAVHYEPLHGDAKQFVARHTRMLGTAEKGTRDDYFDVRRAFGPHEVVVVAKRDDICERVVLGTKTVEVKVPPPGVEMLTETREVEVVEWVCPESILAAGAQING